MLKRIPWQSLPGSFRADVECYSLWASVPDPLDEAARAPAPRPRAFRLQRQHLHSAASAAVAAGVDLAQLTSLAVLVEPKMVRTVLKWLWQHGGRLTAYTDGVAITLIAIAADWVKAPPETIASLKVLRKKLGALPSGLTEKNEAVLRAFDDPRLLAALVWLPDRLWRQARPLFRTPKKLS